MATVERDNLGLYGGESMTMQTLYRKLKNGDSISGTFAEGLAIARGRTTDRGEPTHLPDQNDKIQNLFNRDEEVWMFFFDAGRYDIFEQLYPEYFEGELERVWNGNVGYTGDWCVRNLEHDFGNRGVFSYVPLRGTQDVDYHDREHFNVAPEIRTDLDRMEQLAQLGYLEKQQDRNLDISPEYVNASVRNHMGDINGGVIRYLKPHPPFEGMVDITSESTKTAKTQDALDQGAISYQDLTDAYIETYRVAFEHAQDLIQDLDGKIVITSDHGTCLTCGQLFHGRHHEKHDHLTHMPWFEVEGVV